MKPSQDQILVGAAREAFSRGDISHALALLKSAIAIDHWGGELSWVLGDTLLRLGRLHEAQKAFEQGLALNPRQPFLLQIELGLAQSLARVAPPRSERRNNVGLQAVSIDNHLQHRRREVLARRAELSRPSATLAA